ncbi:MAG TPA: hypothetical protein VGF67_09465 [Ktedonobacteraceae bacterium]|jgi:hypothetical protein
MPARPLWEAPGIPARSLYEEEQWDEHAAFQDAFVDGHLGFT